MPADTQSTVITDLTLLAPPPSSPPLSGSARARIEIDLRAAIKQDDTGRGAGARRRLEYVLPAVLVAACLTAVASLVVLALSGSPSPVDPSALPVRADGAAVHALNGLTTIALETKTPVVRDDQYVYVRSEAITNDGAMGGPVALSHPHERQIWLSQSPVTENQGLIREFGHDWPIGGDSAVPAGPDRPTYHWIASLPTDPDQIITELSSEQQPGSPLSPDEYTFEQIGNIIGEGLVPPTLSGALFQAVTKIPGVTYEAHVEDAIGRSGFGISRTDEFSGIKTTWIFAPGSSSPLGTRWYFTRGTPAGSAGTLFGATAVLERGVADQAGQRPAGDEPNPA